jgi:integrase
MGAWKDKKRAHLIAKFQYQKKRYKRGGFKSKLDAMKWEMEKREELEAPITETPSISFQELATEYLTFCHARMQKNTWRQKIKVHRDFLKFSGKDMLADKIAPIFIERYLNGRVRSAGNKSANRDLREIKALYNWAIAKEIVFIRNPTRSIEPFPEEPYIPYIPPLEDINRVKLAADRDARDFLEILFHLAARKSEVARLIWEDVNFEQRWVRLYTRKRKGGEMEIDYLEPNESLYEILKDRYDKRDKSTPNIFSFTEKQLRNMMSELCQKTRVRPFGFHAIRHYVASVINDSGKASMKQIQGVLRHKRQSTTEKYLHVIDKGVAQALRILDGKRGGVKEENKQKE